MNSEDNDQGKDSIWRTRKMFERVSKVNWNIARYVWIVHLFIYHRKLLQNRRTRYMVLTDYIYRLEKKSYIWLSKYPCLEKETKSYEKLNQAKRQI